MGKCHFNKTWLETHSWLGEVKDDTGKAKCKLCNKDFSVSNKGYADVKQHIQTSTHQSNENAAAKTATIDKFMPSKLLATGFFFFIFI